MESRLGVNIIVYISHRGLIDLIMSILAILRPSLRPSLFVTRHDSETYLSQRFEAYNAALDDNQSMMCLTNPKIRWMK